MKGIELLQVWCSSSFQQAHIENSFHVTPAVYTLLMVITKTGAELDTFCTKRLKFIHSFSLNILRNFTK